MKITKNEEFKEELNYSITDNTTYINLENDPELEKQSIKYLSKNDPNYSYVTSLSKVNDNNLLKIFNEFVLSGGSIVYVYTTGTNIEQMYNYSKIALKAGLSKFEFEFNCDLNEGIDEFLEWLNSKSVKVTLL